MGKILKFTADVTFYALVLFAAVVLTLQIVRAQNNSTTRDVDTNANANLTGNSIEATRPE